ncbi:ABC transporter permease [Oceanobacillus neutriphilus]|uniref:ABC transporter permease n=1 Tax=Oceanobacillus neutriphilus TaxID=531815 RepID=A0ABQ2NXR8_9BACI|nr:ABC transporter permease [Oceanobacillus neutriphilus]GGP13252.1 ABC transporter permease [Oceanobacillus neutriphilus]
MNRKKIIAIIVRILLYAFVIGFFVYAGVNGYFSPIFEQSDTFWVLVGQHLNLVIISSFLAIAIALPLAVLFTRPRFRKFEWIASNVANLAQTVPSLAVLALAIGILGVGFKPAVFALFIYSVLPIFRNAVAGFNSINPDLIDAGKGMGMKAGQIFWRVEVPNAAYAIIGGLRTAVVLNIGTAALAYYIGGGGLGVWIMTGIELFDNAYLISGAIPVTLMAIGFDYLLRGVGYVISPKSTRQTADTATTT